MPTDLGAHTWLQLIGVQGETPENLMVYAGRLIGLTEQQVAVFPTDHFDILIIDGQQVPGYYTSPGGNEHFWFMQPFPDPNQQAVDIIPGQQGWADPNAKQVYYNIGSALLGLGVPGANVRAGLKQLYDAAVQTHVTQQQGGS